MLECCGNCKYCMKDKNCDPLDGDVYICTCKESERYGMVYSEYKDCCKEWSVA